VLLDSSPLPRRGSRVVGSPLPHDSAVEHVTGRALYLDDTPPIAGELLVDFVGSPVAHGRIRKIDCDRAANIPGIVAVLTSSDVPGETRFGPVFHDEDVLASETLEYLGQPVVLLAAESREALRLAKPLVTIDAEPLRPVLTIDDALALGQFLGPSRRIARGDARAALERSESVLEGTLRSGGQEHFALETQAAIAFPGESGAMVIHSSTQNPSEVQAVVARCLSLSLHQVVCECKRMGGAFGGKESQAAHPALMAALVAHKTGRAARVVYSRDQEMRVTGKRHPYLARYKVGFDGDGRITALIVSLASDGGASADLSLAVMERSMLHVDNAYYLPDVEITGVVCKTNLPPNTAFRGFGGPQGIAVIETILEEIASALGIDALDVRTRNLYGPAPRDITPYCQVVRNHTLPKVLDRLAESSGYRERRREVNAFNATSRAELKGLALSLVKFGISFTRRTLNQGNALVNVYLDGTIQVSTGGTEMGQGLNTKIAQLVAGCFALDVAHVRVMPTSTDKNANTSPTAASAGTDLNGKAAVRAAQAIRKRLADFAAAQFVKPGDGIEASPRHVRFRDRQVFDVRRPSERIAFAVLVKKAYEARIDLGARGFYATPGVDFDRETGRGSPFFYYTTGAASAVVRIDRLTGDLKVERVDILMDIGRSINPAIDRGQIIGGFMQGLGWTTTEELLYTETGALVTASPTNYKIPGVHDLPEDLRVSLLDEPGEPLNVYRSKGVGEPPFVLGWCVWGAVKDAIRAALGRSPDLRIPATREEILRHLGPASLADGLEDSELLKELTT
jgi:xanthine dehydrogenase large subunit